MSGSQPGENTDASGQEPAVLTFDRFVVGKSYGSLTEAPDDALVGHWRRLYPQDDFPPDCAPPAIATVLMMRAYMHLLSPRPPGNIHARQQMTLDGRLVTCLRLEGRLVDLDAAHVARLGPVFGKINAPPP